MRPFAAIAFLVAGCLHAQPGSIAGVVADQTGKPLPGVHIRLIYSPDDGPEVAFGADSDSAGHFAMDGLKSGLYMVTAERAGYVQQSYQGTPSLVIKPGQHDTDFKIAMAERVLIAGHVLDEFGDPVQNISVQAMAAERDGAGAFGESSANTDERGEFRLLTGPGKFRLKAEMRQFRNNDGEIRTDGTPSGRFVATFYPSAANAAAASVVEAAAGQDMTGMEIRLLRVGSASGHGLTISGIVTGVPENSRAVVMLRHGETAGQFSEGRSSSAGHDGKFKFEGMQPGFYSVAAFLPADKTSLQSHTTEFRMDADQTGIVLALAPGEDLPGKLEVAGDGTAGAADKYTVRLEGWGIMFGMGSLEAQVGRDGTFRIAAVPPSKFTPVIEPMPENGYLKEVSLDGKAVADDTLDFSQGVGAARLKIVVSLNGAQVSGRVLDQDGEPELLRTTIYLARDAKHLVENGPQNNKGGKYSFKGVRPGKYRIVAVGSALLMQIYNPDGSRDEDAMQKILDAGAEIEVKEGDRISKDISALTKLPQKKEPY